MVCQPFYREFVYISDGTDLTPFIPLSLKGEWGEKKEGL
jgi:hypothetical protein